MTSLRVSSLTFAFVLAACSESTTPPAADAGHATDMSVGIDGGPLDGAVPSDAELADGRTTDAHELADMCLMPPCLPPPSGCHTEPPLTPCTCGEIKCDDAGVVGASCGGRAGPCNSTNFCDFTVPFDCGFTDGTGICQPRPEICPSLYMPVCGCDGATYSNTCDAHASGVDVAADGECAVAADCRTTGCASGETCQACRGPGGGVYVCIPVGAVC